MLKQEKTLFHPVEMEAPHQHYAALLKKRRGGEYGEPKATRMYFPMSETYHNAFTTGETKPPHLIDRIAKAPRQVSPKQLGDAPRGFC